MNALDVLIVRLCRALSVSVCVCVGEPEKRLRKTVRNLVGLFENLDIFDNEIFMSFSEVCFPKRWQMYVSVYFYIHRHMCTRYIYMASTNTSLIQVE